MDNRHRVAALKRGAARTAKVVESVEEAMRAVVDEMRGNGGIYPHNGGAVSVAELCRRASVNEATLYKPANADLKARVVLFVGQLKTNETVGRKRVKKDLKQRIHDWHERFEALDSHNIVINLQLQQAQAEIVRLTEQNTKLLAEHNALLEQVREGGNVTSIRRERPNF